MTSTFSSAPRRLPAAVNAVGRLGWRARTVAFPLIIGVALIVYNQRIGWVDRRGPNWFAFGLRSDIWFVVTILLALLLMPKRLLWPRGQLRAARSLLLTAPALFALSFLFATVLTTASFGVVPNPFGGADFIKVLIVMCIGILTFNFAQTSERLVAVVIGLLTWAPMANVIAAVLAMTVPFGEVFMDMSGSGRFRGVASSPNIVLTQSCIAISLLIPRLLPPTAESLQRRVFLLLYAISLLAVMVGTGVRAGLAVLPIICVIAVWLRFRPTLRSLKRSFLRLGQLVFLFGLAWVAASMGGITEVLLDRLGTEDGRVFLWIYYTGLLFQYPLGLGMAFETIAGATSILTRQRLPPHNMLLEAGMYAGVIGVIISVFMLAKFTQLILRLRRWTYPSRMPVNLQGVILALCSLLFNLMFGGLMYADYNFGLLSSIFLALTARQFASIAPVAAPRIEAMQAQLRPT